MKVCLFYYKFPVYEDGSHIQDFVVSLSKKVEKLYLISIKSPKKAKIPRIKNLTVYWVPSSKIGIINSLVFTIYSVFIVFRKKELRNINIANAICTRSVIPAFLLATFFNKKVLFTIEMINDPNTSLINSLVYKLQKLIYRNIPCNGYVCWSQYHFRKYLESWGIKRDKIFFIPNGINTKQYRPKIDGKNIRKKFGITNSELLLVFAKPLYSYNYPSALMLIKCIKILREKKYNIKLILGKGNYEKRLLKHIAKLNLGNSVFFMPYVKMSRIPEYLAAADIIVLPYCYSATVSRSLLEAMSMGKPIVTTSVGEIPYILSNKTNALLTNKNIHDISIAVEKVIVDKGLRKQLGDSSRKLALKKYSIEKVTEQTMRCFKSILQDE